MKQITLGIVLVLCSGALGAADNRARIAEALSAAPPSITDHATVKDASGNVLRKGSNGWTCYPGSQAIGPMCNRAQWDTLLAALGKRENVDVREFSISYMLAGEGEAIGVSNSDPFATNPHAHGDHVKEGPHLMILVPDAAALESLPTDPTAPVYVMWKGTPYAHIMVKISE